MKIFSFFYYSRILKLKNKNIDRKRLTVNLQLVQKRFYFFFCDSFDPYFSGQQLLWFSCNEKSTLFPDNTSSTWYQFARKRFYSFCYSFGLFQESKIIIILLLRETNLVARQKIFAPNAASWVGFIGLSNSYSSVLVHFVSSTQGTYCLHSFKNWSLPPWNFQYTRNPTNSKVLQSFIRVEVPVPIMRHMYLHQEIMFLYLWVTLLVRTFLNSTQRRKMRY